MYDNEPKYKKITFFFKKKNVVLANLRSREKRIGKVDGVFSSRALEVARLTVATSLTVLGFRREDVDGGDPATWMDPEFENRVGYIYLKD